MYWRIYPINDISKNKDVVIVEPSYNLTDTEIDALPIIMAE